VTSSTSTPTNTLPTAEAPSQTLKPGDTGAQVKILQRALAALGFSPGKADGDYGPVTQTEVEKFQLSKGLAEDGVVGPKTLAALQQALSG
jgi:peptidoglycan hydrolase-like protein with peptidoglycan-binding domain